MINPMLKSTLVLTLVCLIAAALLGATYIVTADKIDEQAKLTLDDNLKQVFPSAEIFEEQDGYYIAKSNNEVIGYAATGETSGYGGIIKLLIGVDKNNKLTGVRIMEQSETPGLGANLVKPEFYIQFDGLSQSEIALKRDNGKIDAITGATITTSAVIKGIKDILSAKLGKVVDANTADAVTQESQSYPENNNSKEKMQLANPASVYCIKNRGKLEIRSNDKGQYGICIFPNGKECEEWTFYRGECSQDG